MWVLVEDQAPAPEAWCWISDGVTVWLEQWLGSAWRFRDRWPAMLGEPTYFMPEAIEFATSCETAQRVVSKR